MIKKKLVTGVLKKAVIALVPTLFFGVLALLPSLGYVVQTRVNSIDKHYELYGTSDYVFAVINFKCNASFNPLLYPVSWLSGKGSMRGNFSMIYLPFWRTGVTKEGEQYFFPFWGKQKVIEGEASMKIIMEEFLKNLPFLPAIFFAVELTNRRRLYLLFLGGTAGFVLGSVIGAFVGVSLVAFSTFILMPMLRKHSRANISSPEYQATET